MNDWIKNMSQLKKKLLSLVAFFYWSENQFPLFRMKDFVEKCFSTRPKKISLVFDRNIWQKLTEIWQNTQKHRQNFFSYNQFLLYNKQKLLVMNIFLKTTSLAKKHPAKVTSTAFLFREKEQLTIYQLLPNPATVCW